MEAALLDLAKWLRDHVRITGRYTVEAETLLSFVRTQHPNAWEVVSEALRRKWISGPQSANIAWITAKMPGPIPGPFYRIDLNPLWSGIDQDQEVDAEQDRPVTIPADLQQHLDQLPPNDRPAYRRDHTWLFWHTTEGIKPAAIRDRWNSMDVAIRKAISPSRFDDLGPFKEQGRRTVAAGIRRAKKERPKQVRSTRKRSKKA
jgi:hypothetical protein